MSVYVVSSLPWLRPANQNVFASPIVNSTYPSPAAIACCDRAPASPQPLQPPVFCNVVPETDALTRSVHTTS